jgi:methyltransferase (TIGR00027 family)
MQDAELPKPVCGDVYAKVFMSPEGSRILDTFKAETGPNTSNVARHRIIDDFLRQELTANPNLCVIIIGAGFDTRAFRLTGGVWVELDEPQVIVYKEELLPASDSKNELHRIPIDFSTDLLDEKLSPFSNRAPVVVVIEGVFMYLEQGTIDRLLRTLRRLFPHHKLICDLMTREFFEKYGKTIHEKLILMGATIKFTVDNPEEIFLKNDYRFVDKIPIVEKSVRFKLPTVPNLAWKVFARFLPHGYSIYVFSHGLNGKPDYCSNTFWVSRMTVFAPRPRAFWTMSPVPPGPSPSSPFHSAMTVTFSPPTFARALCKVQRLLRCQML